MGMLSWKVLVLTLFFPFAFCRWCWCCHGWARWARKGVSRGSSVWTSNAPAILMGSSSRIVSFLPNQILGNFPSRVSSVWHSHCFWGIFHRVSLYKRSFNVLNCAVSKGWCVQGVWNSATGAGQAHQHSGLPSESLLMISEDNFQWLKHFHKSREGTPLEIPLFIYL